MQRMLRMQRRHRKLQLPDFHADAESNAGVINVAVIVEHFIFLVGQCMPDQKNFCHKLAYANKNI